MSKPVKIILIALAVIAGLYILIAELLTVAVGGKSRNETEYTFVVDNKTADTLYIEKPIDDVSRDKVVSIDDKKYLMVLPDADEIYAYEVETEGAEPSKWPIMDTLILIRRNSLLKFVFNEKQKINITIDPQGNKTITRMID